MSGTPFEIKDDEINVEEIMQKIRENIRRRKAAGVYPADPDPAGVPRAPAGGDSGIARDLAYLSGNWNIQNNSYFISSHRPVAGKVLVKGRELIHGEVRRYVDPVIWKQAEFNRATGRVLEGVTRQVSGIESLREEILSEVGEQVRSEVAALAAEMKAEITREIREQVQAAILAMDTDIENRTWLAKVLEERALRSAPGAVESPGSPSTDAGVNYFAFEDHFRGSREDIRERQRAFVHYFEGCSNVLDIGCGRGEFLELMRDAGVNARGVDLDETMAEFCRSRGLEVELNDAVSYLEHLDDSSLDGVFIDQVVEHLEPAYLVRLLELCHRKMKFGYYLVAETVNPLSFVSLANFYIDMTHVRPVHPATLKFLFGAAGFREIEAQFSSPVPDEVRLRRLPVDEGMGEAEKQRAEIYNMNVDLLNGTLYGAQDYAVIGKK
ncbi:MULTISPECIES: class I SAM-dependent methyltransferase [unclassified Methanoculleus]|uniref:class I SAM-dependent methyltransferase n=3 Tax=Methanoculleus TaxID=45989 RepID=UPI0025F59809|nr:class I SAM-dependent methyltransferase [Methanoculleus sp. UBA377]